MVIFSFFKKKHLKNILAISFTFLSLGLFAQKLEVAFHNSSDSTFFEVSTKKTATDSISALFIAKDLLLQLQTEGYLTATIDSISKDKNRIIFHVNKGPQFIWIKLGGGNVNEEILSRIGYRDKLFFNLTFDPVQFSRMMQKLLLYYENHGYPFAQVKLDSILLSDNTISANLSVQRNDLLKIDSILVRGDAPISKKYLHSFLGIKQGDIYNHALLMRVSDKIRRIPFLKETKPFQIQYYENKTKLVLFLEKSQASSFNGIIGASTDEKTSKLRLTGDVDLNLINAFHKGENIRFKWRSLEQQSQDLKFKFLYPYLLGTPLGFDFDFGLFKKDTTYLNLETIVGVRYHLYSTDYFKIFIKSQRSNLLSKQSYLGGPLQKLPSYADSKVKLYGAEYSMDRLNYKYNPTKGISFMASFAFGTKKIDKITELEERNPTIYENVKLKSQQYNAVAEIQYFFMLSQRNTILLANKSAAIHNDNLFRNELLRIGGLRTLRGFDEEAIYASSYSIFTLEYRFLLERNSFLSIFSDAAYYENKSREEFVSDWPIGIGAGVSFESGAGIFTLNYALGKQFNNPFYLKSGKVHFGFINFF